MKSKKITLLVGAALILGAQTIFSQTAQLQVIHNSADPAAKFVDVYVNGSLALDNFEFRKATPYLSLPAGVPLNIGVAPGNSTSVNDTLKNFNLTLANGQKYIAMANGVLNPASFSPNPGSLSTAFNLYIKSDARTQALDVTKAEFVAFHGATDAPTVDVEARRVATLVDDASYGDFTSYLAVPPSTYILDVTPAAGSPILISYEADLSTLTGASFVVFASGFLNTAANQNGDAFGLFAALSDGTVLQLPTTSQARLQVIHNCADPAAAIVDVYINGVLSIDDFAFRAATPYIDLDADVALNIGIAPGTSTSVNDTLVNYNVTLVNGETYLAIASGVLNPANFGANPDGGSTGFNLLIQDMMMETAGSSSEVAMRIIHGSTDAPAVDIIARRVATLVDNAPYGAITSYIPVPPSNYILDITPAAGSPILVSYEADLTTLGGSSLVAFASGFLNPSANQNGAAFGVYVALADGTVIPLPQTSQARLQVIHNCADPAAATVDVYVNGALALDNFAFRTATPYIDLEAGVPLNVGIAPGNSTSINDTLVNFNLTLANGETYLAVASGVLNPANFAANPDGISTAFNLLIQDQMKETAVSPSEVSLRVVHGATDAPTVDVFTGATNLVNDAPYFAITPYINVPSADYVLDVKPAADNNITVASYLAPLSAIPGQSAVVLASGFLNPAANQNGEAFVLIAVLADGTVLILQAPTGIQNTTNNTDLQVFPNPAVDFINIASKNKIVSVTITDITGKQVSVNTPETQNDIIKINTNNLTSGVYFVTTQLENERITKKLLVK